VSESVRPKLLDLFCGAGGAAMGYHRAGFDVVGVDHVLQPCYPFAFVEADALDFLRGLTAGASVCGYYLQDFAAIHASPPCQRYSQGTKRWVGRSETHPDQVAPVRDLLSRTGATWAIENVVGSPLVRPILLCGTMFGLKVFRHRLFESNIVLLGPAHGKHDGTTGAHRGYSTATSGRNGFVCVAGHNFERSAAALAMGIDWMSSRKELAQAIPPAYTEFIGRQLMNTVALPPSEIEP